MKKFFLFATALILASSLILADSYFVFAGKSKKKNKPETEKTTFQATNTEGKTNIFGSVLDPNVNQVLILLPKSLLNIIRKLGSTKVSVNITSSLDSTKTFKVPSNAISIQRRRINNKGPSARFLVVNISSLTTTSNITISPATLPSSDYNLKVAGGGLNVTSENLRYHTPVLIVGTVKSKSTGFVTVEDLKGKTISEKTVAINQDGTFITEVRADKIKRKKNNGSAKKYLNLRSQKNGEEPPDNEDISTSEENNDNIDTALVHAVTEKDLFALTPLDNSVENNAIKAKKPLEISEGTSFTANIGKEYEELAETVAEEQLEKLQQEEPLVTFEDFGCDIFKFADRCSGESEETLFSIGADFKNFVQTESCTFPEFNLIKEIVTAAPDEVNSFIGKGYCEHVLGAFEDEEKPCETFAQILEEFNSGLLSYLPCPPEFCTEFSEIKPPECVTSQGFCTEGETVPLFSGSSTTKICQGSRCKPIVPGCIITPVRDPFCGRIGVDLTEFECLSQSLFTQTTWTTVTNSKGNTYCVPTEIKNFSSSEVITPEKIGEECEVNACHKKCEEDFLQTRPFNFTPANPNERCEVCDCHVHCDVEAGRFFDCTGSNIDLFSAKCCNETISSSFPQFFQQGGLGKAPIRNNIEGCLCENLDNFQENGLAKEEAIDICIDSCPEGYEVDPFNESICLPICEEETFRDLNGICRKKCSPGLIEDPSGNCSCPEGFVIGKSGRCEPNRCPEHCKNIPLVRKYLEQISGGGSGAGSSSPSSGSSSSGPPSQPSTSGPKTNFGTGGPGGTTGTSIPQECSRCFGWGFSSCPQGFKKDPITGNCLATNQCGSEQYLDSNGSCRCITDNNIAAGPDSCKKQIQCGSNMLPNNVPGEASCICPATLPYWDSSQCVAQCPPGSTPSINFSALPRSPIPCIQATIQCLGSTPYLYNGTCVASCPIGLIPTIYSFHTTSGRSTLKAHHTPTTTSSSQLECLCPNGTRPAPDGSCGISTPCPPAIPYRCSNGTCAISASSCSTTRACIAGEIQSIANCSCASPGYTTGPNTPCICPSGYSIAYSAQGCGSTLRYCATTEPATPLVCQCAPPATPIGPNGTCQCPTPGQPYSATGCGPYTLPFCSPGQSATNPPSVCSCPSGSAPTGTGGSCLCTNGQLYTGTVCPTAGATPTPTPSQTATPTPSQTAIPTPTPQVDIVTLSSVVISGTDVIVNFYKNFATCAHLLNSSNAVLHIVNFFCTTGSNTTYVQSSSFNPSLQLGQQVKLCHGNNYSICSPLVYVTSSTPSPTPTSSPSPTPGIPNTPTGLAASTSSGNVTLNWIDNSSDETGFSIYRRPSGGTTWTPIGGTVTSITIYTDSGLASGTYEYKVNACNASGCSADSVIAIVTVGGTVPASPTALTATLSGENVNLNWIDNSTDETSFNISRRPTGGSWASVASTAVSITTYTDSGLAAGTYDYHVNACNANGCSPDSNIVTITK